MVPWPGSAHLWGWSGGHEPRHNVRGPKGENTKCEVLMTIVDVCAPVRVKTSDSAKVTLKGIFLIFIFHLCKGTWQYPEQSPILAKVNCKVSAKIWYNAHYTESWPWKASRTVGWTWTKPVRKGDKDDYLLPSHRRNRQKERRFVFDSYQRFY